jgi:hypothetical protein
MYIYIVVRTSFISMYIYIVVLQALNVHLYTSTKGLECTFIY